MRGFFGWITVLDKKWINYLASLNALCLNREGKLAPKILNAEMRTSFRAYKLRPRLIIKVNALVVQEIAGAFLSCCRFLLCNLCFLSSSFRIGIDLIQVFFLVHILRRTCFVLIVALKGLFVDIIIILDAIILFIIKVQARTSFFVCIQFLVDVSLLAFLLEPRYDASGVLNFIRRSFYLLSTCILLRFNVVLIHL